MTSGVLKKIVCILILPLMLLNISLFVPIEAKSDKGQKDVATKAETKNDYVPGELLVVTDKGVSEGKIESVTKEHQGRVKEEISISAKEKVSLITVKEKKSLDEVSNDLAEEDEFSLVQPNYVYKSCDLPGESQDAESKNERKQWYLYEEDNGANIKGAWNLLKKRNSVKVAVIDTGVWIEHEDLKNSVNTSDSVSVVKGVCRNLKGDNHTHGTMVTGVLAAESGNKVGIKGASDNLADVIAIAAGDKDASFSSKDIVVGLKHAMRSNAKVVNMSFSGNPNDTIVLNQVKKAYESGILCVSAAGNDAYRGLSCPGDSIYGIGVMSHDQNGDRSDFSNYGADKDVSAPGESIYTTMKSKSSNSAYSYAEGTSFSAPIVSSVAVLLLSENPNLKPRDLKNLIYTGAGGKFSEKYGFGKINAKKSLSYLQQEKVNPTSVELNRTVVDTYENSVTGVEYAILPGNTNTSYAEVTSSNPKVATANSAGEIHAKKSGKCDIIFTAGNVKKVCHVRVHPRYVMKSSGKPYIYNGRWDINDALSRPLPIDDVLGSMSSFMDGYKIYLKKGELMKSYISFNDAFPMLVTYNPKMKRVKSTSYEYVTKGNRFVGIYAKYKAKESGYHYIEAVQADYVPAKYKLFIITNMGKTKARATSKKGKIKIQWNKAGNASQYMVYVYGSNKKLVKKARVKGLKYTYKKARRGRKYYYRVRPCIKIPLGYVYGGYSAKKKIKVRR